MYDSGVYCKVIPAFGDEGASVIYTSEVTLFTEIRFLVAAKL